ncbi:immunity 49 family protein [Pelagibaculum spongiae]|uniref:Uncharacterized protein n=1 Tax=Pelagibaculum spongiae TaxID=2080658 RepID=A0A2V1GZ46_9GAMM|nr:immunity 49 family protein [Pelagibaculum spongiae]PVZ72341.1 hypothetical protein DC094_04860 [Pelagibaculum spongiae]
MIEKIKLHQHYDSPVFLLERKYSEGVTKYYDQDSPKSPGPLWFSDAGDAFAAALALNKSKQKVLRRLKICLQLRTAQFLRATHAGQPITIEVDGNTWHETGNGDRSFVRVGEWLDAYELSLILRDTTARNFLMQMPDELLMEARSRSSEKLFYLTQIQFIKSLYDAEKNSVEYFQRMYQAAMDVEIGPDTHPSRRQMLDKIMIPVVELFGIILGQDENSYQQAMDLALRDHEAWFTKDDSAMQNSGGWYSTRLLAMAALAWDQRQYQPLYAEPIFKQYIPEWLVKGDFKD